MSDQRAANPRRNLILEAGYTFLVIALASASTEAGVQYFSVFGPARTGVGIEGFDGELGRLLLHGRGNAWVVDGEGRHRLIPHWWGFLAWAAAGAILVKAPLLLAPAWVAGRAIARRGGRWPLWVDHLAAGGAGAAIGIAVFYAYECVMNRDLVWRVWLLPFQPGFGGCLAGGACGVIALSGRGRRRGLTSLMVEVALIDVIVLGTAWVVRCR